MAIEVKVPLLPESISDATVSTWHKKAGDQVSRDENIVDLETDKVMLEVPAPADGILKQIIKPTGSIVHAQEVIAVIDTAAGQQPQAQQPQGNQAQAKQPAQPQAQQPQAQQPQTQQPQTQQPQTQAQQPQTQQPQAQQPQQPQAQQPQKPQAQQPQAQQPQQQPSAAAAKAGPSARRVAAEHDMDISQVSGTGKGGRITKENVMTAVSGQQAAAQPAAAELSFDTGRPEKRVPMTRIRARIAQRLLEVKQSTAMLTTFNEINMSEVMQIRNRYKEKFEKTYNIRLGFMSFFVRACVEALKRFPDVNASLDGNDVIYHGYYDMGVAVSTDRGLVVPVLRDADKMSMAQIEAKISEFAEKARSGKLTLEDMQGGTFTITNGGVFGSLMATPIINSPQCAILGMHKIQERPVVEKGEVVVRPMMYVALSYDHRLIDGKDSVSFLVAVKELLEDPTRMLIEI